MNVERDQVYLDQRIFDLQELMYWVFKNVASQMGFSYELAHRNPSVDFRRLAFSYQLDLLEKLNPQWKELREKELADILKNAPFNDEE